LFYRRVRGKRQESLRSFFAARSAGCFSILVTALFWEGFRYDFICALGFAPAYIVGGFDPTAVSRLSGQAYRQIFYRFRLHGHFGGDQRRFYVDA
jgi:hypothetical protein